nr:MAG TPA: DNA binding protein [Caudoviricetes sp.]
MIKANIADYLINNTTLSRSQALKAVDCVFESIEKSLCKNESVYIRGFGTIKVYTTKERKARNISKGTAVVVPAHNTAKLIISKELKNKMNK